MEKTINASLKKEKRERKRERERARARESDWVNEIEWERKLVIISHTQFGDFGETR